MSKRLICLTLATVITLGLFMLMHYLIIPRTEPPQEEPPSTQIDITREKREEEKPLPKHPVPPKPKAVEEPPPLPLPRTRPQSNREDSLYTMEIPNLGGDDDPLAGGGGPRRATPIVTMPPQYPHRALERGIEGWVLVEFTITSAGTVENIRIVEAEPSNIFNQAALRAMRRWKYQPKMVEGRPVPQHKMREVFRFEIEDTSA